MEKEFSPEERLLQLIKGKSAKYHPEQKEKQGNENLTPEPAADSGINKTGSTLDTKPAESAAGAGQPETAGNAKIDVGLEDRSHTGKVDIAAKGNIMHALKVIFLAGFLVLVVAVGYFAFNAYVNKGSQELEDIKSLVASISDREKDSDEVPLEKAVKETLKGKQASPASSIDDYQKIVEAKTIFASPGRTEKPAAMESLAAQDALKGLRLVGIITEKPPQAIIEDMQNKQTLFLGEGEMIGKMQVQQILSDRVILVYDGQSVTLSL
jgi:hypothetical protein